MVCPNCKQETIPALFCHACDAYLPNPGMGVKASVARRFGALLLDSIAIWVVFFIVFLLSAGMAGIGMSTGSSDAGIGAFILTFLGAAVAYPIFALWFLSKGKTPGKWLVGIRAADKSNGSLPGLGRMLVRETIGKFLSGLFFGLGYFWAIFDKDAQCWHDKVAGTVVLRQPVAAPVVASAIVTTPAEPPPVTHVRQSADVANELSTATSSPEPGNQVVPRYRHSPIWWVLGGFALLAAIVLGGLSLNKQTAFSPLVQRSIPPQTFAPPQQKALGPATAKHPERTTQIVREFPNFCPGEGGCIFGKWTAKSDTPVYQNRSTSSRIVFRLRKGQQVDGLSAVLDINRMGKAVATQNTSKSQTGVALRAGQAVEIYYYEGEGCVMIEVDGAPKDFCAWESLREVTAPAITLWLQVKNSAGTNGWSNKREMFVGTSQYDQPDQNTLSNLAGTREKVNPQNAANPMRQNQESAIGALRIINTAEILYATSYPSAGFSKTLVQLGPPPGGVSPTIDHAGLIGAQEAAGVKAGYRFIYKSGPSDQTGVITAFTDVARPLEYGTTGLNSYFTDESGVVRVTQENREPTAKDHALQ